MAVLYHVASPKLARRYRATGAIVPPVRGFDTLLGAMWWAMKTNRTIVYAVECDRRYPMPDHHNRFGNAVWTDEQVPVARIKCVVSAHRKDADAAGE